MSEEVDVRVTPSLHPGNVKKLEGYDESTAPYLGPVETAFSEAYLGIADVHTARDKALLNPALTDAGRVIATDDYAQKVFARIARNFDSVSANLEKSITSLEAQLTAPITSKAANSVSAEIRNYTKGLQTAERMGFMQKALDSGDDVTLSAILGAPAYLSGIDPKTQEIFTRMHHERASPAVAKRVRAMKAGRDLLGQRGGLLLREMEKAVGQPPHKVQAMRAAKAASEQAFVVRGT